MSPPVVSYGAGIARAFLARRLPSPPKDGRKPKGRATAARGPRPRLHGFGQLQLRFALPDGSGVFSAQGERLRPSERFVYPFDHFERGRTSAFDVAKNVGFRRI